MDEQAQKLRVGIYTIIVLLILTLIIVLFSDGFARKYTIYVKPQHAPGVKIGTPIRKNGILIGRVGSVQNQDDSVVLGLDIDEHEKIYANETVSIGTESLLGDAGIEIVGLPKEQRGSLMRNRESIATVINEPNPMELIDIVVNLGSDVEETLGTVREAGEAVGEAAKGIDKLTMSINVAFADEDSDIKRLITDIRQLSNKAEAAVDNVDRIFNRVADFLEDPKVQEDLNDFVQSLPPIFKEIRVAISDAGKIINTFGTVSEKASENLDNLSTFTKSLGITGPEILDNVNDGVGEIREGIGDIREGVGDVRGLIKKAEGFGDTLTGLQEIFGNKEGTIGKLFNSTELYDEVLVSLKNVREFSETIQNLDVKLKPIFNDVRSFTDALARDPGLLGVRGALDRRPGKTGYKTTPGTRSFFR